MLDVICTQNASIRIDRSEFPADVVKSRLLKLGHAHIEYVLDCIDETTTKIRNIRNYLLTALYNSFTTMDSYYRTAVNHDFKKQEEGL
jgi:tRNA A37 threonylcarbamoyladenosine dehydratase